METSGNNGKEKNKTFKLCGQYNVFIVEFQKETIQKCRERVVKEETFVKMQLMHSWKI